MDPERRQGWRTGRVRSRALLAGIVLAAVLVLGAGWMRGWWFGEKAGVAKGSQEVVYDLGNGVELTLCWCPPGTFWMGSPAGEAGRFDNERQHEVRLSRGFWMAKTETTQEQWEAVMTGNPSASKGRRLPVDSVTWEEAREFAEACRARLRHEGKLPVGWEFRLPSEAQWEYACRAGTAMEYFTGNGEAALQRAGWYGGNSARRASRWTVWLQSLPVVGGRITGSTGGEPKAVGQKEANGFGLQDMHGNVWEWCEDWYGEYGVGSVVDPVGPPEGDARVLRGGSWYNDADGCRAAFRDWRRPDNRYRLQGFRVCLVPGPAAEPQPEE